MLIGGAIGDALGMPVETWTPQRIEEVHGRIEKYVDPVEHKWFTSDPDEKSNRHYMPAGSTTDDTQLTLATLHGIVRGHVNAIYENAFFCYLDSIAIAHVEAFKKSTVGWGKTTVEAVQRLKDGTHWHASGMTDNAERGTGNGIPMKCSPLSVLIEQQCSIEGFPSFDAKQLVHYAAMTHYTKMAAESGFIHNMSLIELLNRDVKKFKARHFAQSLYCLESTGIYSDFRLATTHLYDTKDNLLEVMKKVATRFLSKRLDLNQDFTNDQFGGGSCYVYDSLPFSYSKFLKNPTSVECILDAVNSGGDTDTNAKIVGEMVGALNGIEIFQTPENRWMIEELPCAEEILEAGRVLCGVLGVT